MEDFVTFEIAKKLKEKGFPIKTKTEGKFGLTEVKEVEILPTISQVLKWLREEKDIHIEPCILADADIDADGKVINEFTYWSFSIMSIANGDMIYFEYEHIDDMRFDSYEEATIDGIEYVIDNLI
jgi:hypothetical protein